MIPKIEMGVEADSIIDIGGVAVGIETSLSAARSTVTDRFGSQPANTTEPAAQLTIRRRSSHDQRPAVGADHIRHQLEGCNMVETEAGVILDLGGASDVVIDGASATVRCDPQGAPGNSQLGALMQFGVSLAIAEPDRLLAHGATIADGSEAVLIVGLSGQGKSTAALAAAVGPFSLRGDDLAVINVAEMTATGVQRRPVVPVDQAERIGLTGEPVAGTGDRQRIRLEPGATSAEPATLIGLIEVGHHDGDGILTSLDSSDLAILDQALAVPPFPYVLRRHLAAMAGLTRLPKVQLLHAVDPERRIDRCTAMLTQAFALFRQSQAGLASG